VPLIAA